MIVRSEEKTQKQVHFDIGLVPANGYMSCSSHPYCFIC